MTSRYPSTVLELIENPVCIGEPESFSARGTGVSVNCGIALKFFLSVEDERITEIGFLSDGCGWAVAGAELLASRFKGRELRELNSLEGITDEIAQRLGVVPGERRQCIEVVESAIRDLFVRYRDERISGWQGDDALVCSCFGVSESVVEAAIDEHGADSVEEIGDICNAGTGCGSCQPVVEDILESRKFG